MCCYSRRRGKLFKRKLFKSCNSLNILECFLLLTMFNSLLILIICFSQLIDLYHPSELDTPLEVRRFVGLYLHCVLFYPIFLVFLVITIFCWIPEKYFKTCSFLAIAHIFLILFLVFHPYQTFVPEPNTEELKDSFKYSYFAAFIWIPLMIVYLFLCAIVSWKASDQSELYAVILDEKGSSTKVMDDV